MKLFFALAIAAPVLCVTSIRAEQPAPPAMSAAELVDRMETSRLGSALIRTKLEVQSSGGAKRVLQLQIKERRTKTATDLVYQVLWPNEHKGEAVILHQALGATTGSIIVPQQPVRAIKSSQMGEGLFDSDLSYQDAVENWKKKGGGLSAARHGAGEDVAAFDGGRNGFGLNRRRTRESELLDAGEKARVKLE